MSSSSQISIDSTVTLNNGDKFPIFGLGTWRSDKGAVSKAVAAAIKGGYRMVDAAFVYGNQDEVGQGLSGTEGVYVVSKIWNNARDADSCLAQAQLALKQLGLKKVDQLLVHWPVAWKGDGIEDLFPKDGDKYVYADLSLADIWAGMERLVDEGLVRTIGVSNFTPEQIDTVLKTARIKPAVNQVEMHAYWAQKELRAYCASQGIHVTAYSPLGNVGGDIKDSPLGNEAIAAIGKRHGKTAAQVLIRWLLQKGVTAIPKTTTESRLAENADVFDFELSDEDVAAIEAEGDKHAKRQCNPPFLAGNVPVFSD